MSKAAVGGGTTATGPVPVAPWASPPSKSSSVVVAAATVVSPKSALVGKAAAAAAAGGGAVQALEPKALALGASLAKSMAADGLGPKKRPWEDDVLSNEDLKTAISNCKTRGIDLDLQALADRIAPSQEYSAAAKKCFIMLQAQVRTALSIRSGVSPLTPELYGAHAQGTELDGAEIDIVLRYPAGAPVEEREAAFKAVKQRLQSPPQNQHLTTTAGMRVYRHAPCTMSVELKDAPLRTVAHLSAVEETGDDKLPTMDNVIKQLCDTFEPSRDLIRLVKLWASNHNLVDHRDGYMGGVGWTLLVIFYMQREMHMPSFASVSQGGGMRSAGRPQLTSLLRDFFLFLAKRQSGPALGASVKTGQEFQPPPGVVLFIEDPTAKGQQVNIADSLSGAQWSRAMEEARKAADRLTARPQRWFHWAEILDPRELPPIKLQSLQDMVAGLPVNGHAEQTPLLDGGCGGAPLGPARVIVKAKAHAPGAAAVPPQLGNAAAGGWGSKGGKGFGRF